MLLRLSNLIRARLLQRDNRFRVSVDLQGRHVTAHLPNSGRLGELLTPGRPVWLAPAHKPGRRTPFDMQLVELETTLVSVDARLPNHLFAEALRAGRLSDFDFPNIQPEVRCGRSRLDFRLSGPQGECWVEIKSVTLVRDRVAMFPDAPTQRGRRHLEDLIYLRQQGHRAAVVFVVQRADATAFTPNTDADPAFAEALTHAAAAGVECRAFTCQVSTSQVSIRSEIPGQLEAR